MQIISDIAKQLVDAYQKITLSVYIDGERLDAGIGSCEYAPSCGGADEFSFGNACAASVTFVLGAVSRDLKGKRIQVKWSVNEEDYPLLTGQIEDAQVSAGRTTVEAWDDMYFGGSNAFSSTGALSTDVDAAIAFAAIAAAIGVEAEQETLNALSGITIVGGFAGIKEETSNSAVAGYIAGLIGGNALITRAGELAVRGYNLTDWKTEPYSGGASAENTDFTVTGITLQRESTVSTINSDGTTAEDDATEEYVSGDGALMVSNPIADQGTADRALAALESVMFRPGSYSFPGGLLLEPGDIFVVESMDGTYQVAAVAISMSFDGGVKTSVACGGAVKSGGSAGTINQALKALYVDFARLRSLVAENATIVSAKISKLSVEDIIAGRIRSTDFETIVLDKIYPAVDLYPGETVYPNNGEQIVRGIEIDFESGVIRGVFFDSVTDALEKRISQQEQAITDLASRISKLETALVYPKSLVQTTNETEEDDS